jgi:hypothetical protein
MPVSLLVSLNVYFFDVSTSGLFTEMMLIIRRRRFPRSQVSKKKVSIFRHIIHRVVTSLTQKPGSCTCL